MTKFRPVSKGAEISLLATWQAQFDGRGSLAQKKSKNDAPDSVFFWGLYAVGATVSYPFMCLVRPLISEIMGETDLFHVPRRVLNAWIQNSGREERASSPEKTSDENRTKKGLN